MKRLLSFGVVALVFAGAASSRQLDAASVQAPPQTPATSATSPATPNDKEKDKEKDEDGVPITNAKVKLICGECHTSDDKGKMARISFRRTTPEGWQETIRRMATLNKVDLEPADAREIVKYLADNLGLAPEEVKPAAFEVERRLIDFKYTASADTERVCASCHSIGRVMLQRRTSREWDLVVAMHRGYYPLVDTQIFRRFGPAPTEPGPDGRAPDSRHPMDKALAHLKTAFPLNTPEWTSWFATMRSPRIAGEWMISGSEPGVGAIAGSVTIAAGATADEFTTRETLRYLKSGQTVTREGRVMVYTGHQWRGRSMVGGDAATSVREVMAVDRDLQSISGRWYRGDYDELGADITLTRVANAPLIGTVDRMGARRGAAAATVRIYGALFPASLAARDVDFGRGITVDRIVSVEPTLVTAEISVAPDATVGPRDLFVAGALRKAALTVYDTLDYIKVTPGWGMARVGGNVFPKQLAQFDVMAFSNGPDGKPETKDDLPVGLVDASWSLEEYAAIYGDDDVKFVGAIHQTSGLFTPSVDGPNPQRSGHRNNVGDVWVVATFTPSHGPAMKARAQLVVTVPLYQRWDFSTMGGPGGLGGGQNPGGGQN